VIGAASPGKEIEMLKVLRSLVRDEAGQDLAEYGIALAIIAAGAGLAAVAIAGNVQVLWTKASGIIAQAAN
jgi:Flp pilus assembly pilin Flp